MSSTTALDTRISAKELANWIEHYIRYALGKQTFNATKDDVFRSLALAVRQRLVNGLLETEERYTKARAKRLYYLSAEFLIGQALRNNLFNLGLLREAAVAVEKFGFHLEDITDHEPDAALGNGGLGRLAACFMESAATLGMPAYGYGINYEFGLFKQEIENGYQKEKPDQWLSQDSPWQIERLEESCVIPLYGRIDHSTDREGNYNPMWVDWNVIVGVPHDIPVAGYGCKTVNYLRLFSARASDEFDMKIFNDGDYLRAVEQKMSMETVSKVLYPSDSMAAGKELRLIQEYFMVACAVRDILRRCARSGSIEKGLAQDVAIQMNDTHPALAVAELMRALVDENGFAWEAAWETTRSVCAYTNHTLMPEALEKWPVALFEKVLPRHLQIIYEINHRFLAEASRRFPGETARHQRLSLIEEGDHRQVRMANLAIVGSHAVNGVAALHSELVKTNLVPDFYQFWPERFSNKTNGVTHRRWLACANPGLAEVIGKHADPDWATDLDKIRVLDALAGDRSVQQEFLQVKRKNKESLAALIYQLTGITVNPESLFDVQVKRMHEYKRQLLHVMNIIHSYLSCVEDGIEPVVPRTHIIAGKAAPGYWMAKLIIKLINNVGAVVNEDPRVKGRLKVVFLPNYRVALAEKIIPAADLSEQISTAGMEASGTGNMKLSMNGALTIGTLDGANVEIREEVGDENIYIFGLRTEEIEAKRGSYNPWDYYHASAVVRRVMEGLNGDQFCATEPGLFRPIYQSILHNGDYYFHLADLESYVASQAAASSDFRENSLWAKKMIHNVARMGKFSSDRTIREYARDIWNLTPIV